MTAGQLAAGEVASIVAGWGLGPVTVTARAGGRSVGSPFVFGGESPPLFEAVQRHIDADQAVTALTVTREHVGGAQVFSVRVRPDPPSVADAIMAAAEREYMAFLRDRGATAAERRQAEVRRAQDAVRRLPPARR